MSERTFGDAVFQAGGRMVVALRDGTGARIRGRFSPSNPLGSATWPEILARYGFPDKPFGYLVGPEGTGLQILQEKLDTGTLRMFLGLPEGYRATTQDLEDARYVAWADGTVWSKLVDPQVAVETPAQPATPSSPTVTPPASSSPALPPLTLSTQRVEELRLLALEAVRRDVVPRLLFTPLQQAVAMRLLGSESWPSISPWAASCLRAWRRVRRDLGDPRPLPPGEE